jgi:hypothetical protein
MLSATENRDGWFRVWLAGCGDWNPTVWSDVPPLAIAIEPAEPHCMTRSEAAHYVESFNRAMIEQSKRLWALPVKVAVRFDGDWTPGQPIGIDVIAAQLLEASELLAAPEQTAACSLPRR